MRSLHASQMSSATYSNILSVPDMPQVTSRCLRVRFHSYVLSIPVLTKIHRYFRRIDIALLEHKMPPEYDNVYSHIYCNDCEKKCHARYHFMYHKCASCKGYNTKLLGTVEGLPENAVMAEDLKPNADSTSTFATIENEESRLSVVSGESTESGSSLSAENADHLEATSVPELLAQSSGYFCHSCEVRILFVVRFQGG